MTTRPRPTETHEVHLDSGLEPETEDVLAEALPGLDADALFLVFLTVAAIIRAWQANAIRPAPSAQGVRRTWGKVAAHAAKLADALGALGGQEALDAVRAVQPVQTRAGGRGARQGLRPREPRPDTFGDWRTLQDQLLTLALTARFDARARRGGVKRHSWPLGLAVEALVGAFVRANGGRRDAKRERAFVAAALQAAPPELWPEARDDEAFVRDYLRKVKVRTDADGNVTTLWEPDA